MANKLGNLNCATGDGGNVGQPACPFIPGPLVGEIPGPKGKVFTAGEIADSDALMAALTAAAITDTYTSRIFPIGPYRGWNATGEARQEKTFDDGSKRLTREATRQTEMTLDSDIFYFGGVKKVIQNQQGTLGTLRVHNQGEGKYAIVGRKAKLVDGGTSMGFFALNTLYASIYGDATGTEVPTWTVTTGYQNADDVDINFVVMLVDGNPFDTILGLNSVDVSVTSPAANQLLVRLTSAGADLHDLYATEFAQVGAHVVTNDTVASADRGDVITIASVASTGVGWLLTLAPPTGTGADPDNPGTGGYVKYKLAVPSVLAALTTPILRLESNSQRVLLS